MNVADRFALKVERAEVRAEIEAIRERCAPREMPIVDLARRREYVAAGEREIAQLEHVLEELA